MAKIEEVKTADGMTNVRVNDKPLACVVCGHQEFHERKTLLNSRRGELFNLAWAEPRAQNYICAECGYIFWFLRRKS